MIKFDGAVLTYDSIDGEHWVMIGTSINKILGIMPFSNTSLVVDTVEGTFLFHQYRTPTMSYVELIDYPMPCPCCHGSGSIKPVIGCAECSRFVLIEKIEPENKSIIKEMFCSLSGMPQQISNLKPCSRFIHLRKSPKESV